jgi:hypothetical protein
MVAPAHGENVTAGLSASARQTLLNLAQTAMPAGRRMSLPGWPVVDRLEAFLATRPSAARRGFEAAAQVFEHAARLRAGRRFSSLSTEGRLGYLGSLFEGSFAERQLVRVLLTPLKVAHYDDPALFAEAGAIYRAAAVAEAPPRYLQRALDAAGLTEDETVEADVVVVGSGAGGAALAAELAEAGLGVVVLEEGSYYRRKDFTGRPVEMVDLLYRDGGVTGTLGNCFIAVPFGRCVGGTTTINSGTCYRTPEWVLHKWRTELGLVDFTSESMDPYFTKVESVLQVARAKAQYVGTIANIIARGCEALGHRRHGFLLRNAPDCDGSSLCIFGCPTDAKRSTNVSFVPLALRAGAHLYYNARVERVLLDDGRAVGVAALSPTGTRLTVRAKAVVLAAGSLMTPALLLRNKLCAASGQVGRNLSLHPALGVLGQFADEIRGASSIPQGYAIEEFHEEGILFEGAFVPLDFCAGSVTFFGPRYTEVMEAYQHMAYFGFMIEDTSRGRVVLGPGGRPLMAYVLNDHDVAQLKRGLEILFRVYLAAGAEAIFPMVHGFVEIRDGRDVERFRNTRLRARDFELTAHHPLGTARMGLDPRTSVVGPTHESHDVPGLFVCDGSAMPSSIGVNPQMTIMALSLRAAQFVARAVERR